MSREIIVAIAGNPNSGKSTVFNRITGAVQQIGNYPGVTVEKKSGTATINGIKYTFVDLPGSYTLLPFSEDESVATDYILGSKPDLILNIIDSSSIQRGLFLTMQLIETGIPIVAGLNMFDVLEKNGDRIDISKLSELLNIPVIKLTASKGEGVDMLLQKIPETIRNNVTLSIDSEKFRKLEEETVSNARYAKIDEIIKEIFTDGNKKADRLTDRIDSVLTHRFLGPVLLLAILYLTFQTVFTLSEYPAGLLESLFGWMNETVDGLISDGYLKSLINSGIIDGVGGVMGFVPLIFILFVMISILEDSGYMARISFMLDRIMRMFGLHGNSVMALVVSGGIVGGCAVPGIMAARTLKDKNERLATILVSPFMSCGAKLPVYALLVAAFFSRNEGGMMMLLTFISWGFALISAFALRKTMLKGDSTAFIMDMPHYHMPSVRNILIHSWDRTWMYIRKAGTVILGISIFMWAMMTFPELPSEKETEIRNSLASSGSAEEEVENEIASSKLSYSIAGRIGKSLETVTKPLTGFDWRTDIALLGGFAAKEVIVSTLGTAYSMGETDPEESEGLKERLEKGDGWNPAVAFALLLFVMLYVPCFVAVAVIRKEAGSWKWALFSIIYSTTLATFATALAYQIGKMFI